MASTCQAHDKNINRNLESLRLGFALNIYTDLHSDTARLLAEYAKLKAIIF